MLRIALGSLLALLAQTPVEAHCFARWYYPWPQHCGVARQTVRAERGHNPTRFREVLSPADIPNQEHPGNEAATRATRATPATALPRLAQADLDGGRADEPTRARLLLRAALEAANGR